MNQLNLSLLRVPLLILAEDDRSEKSNGSVIAVPHVSPRRGCHTHTDMGQVARFPASKGGVTLRRTQDRITHLRGDVPCAESLTQQG